MPSDRPDVPLASLDLLRQITDRHVIDQLLATPTMTRADIAAATGISKPTISESVRRLEESGLVVSAGEQTGRRGRAGTFYALRGSLGVALTLSAGPDGLVAEVFDIRGRLLHRLDHAIPSPVTAAQLDPLLRALVEEALARADAPVRAAALSVAGPVDRATGRLVHLPNAPFLVDELDPRRLLGPLLGPRADHRQRRQLGRPRRAPGGHGRRSAGLLLPATWVTVSAGPTSATGRRSAARPVWPANRRTWSPSARTARPCG